MQVDSLTIDAVVTDSFSNTLDRLSEKLLDVAEAQTVVDENMTIDVDVDGLDELTVLQGQLAAIEGMDLSNIDALDDISISTSSVAASGGGATATADGGPTPDGGGPFSDFSRERLVRTASEAFGDAFDESTLFDRPDRARSIVDFLDGDLSEFVDTEAASRALIEGDLDFDTFENLTAAGEDSVDAFGELDRRGLTNLPTGRFRPLRRLAGQNVDDTASSVLTAFENFDATTLNNLWASLVPLLAVFVGALPAAIAGVVALGGAALAAAGTLGAVGALGALGVALADGQSLADVAEDLRESFLNAFGPIAEALRPTFLEAVDSLEAFLNELGNRAFVLRNFSDELLLALDVVERFVGEGLSNMVAFAAASEEALNSFLEPLEGTSLTRTLAAILADTLPLLRQLFATIVAALPAIYNISRGFLLVASSVIAVLAGFFRLLDTVPGLATGFGVLVAGLLVFVSMTSFAVAVTNIWAASLTQKLVDALVRSALTVVKYVAGLFGYNVATNLATVSTLAFAKAVAVLLSTVTLGIAAVGFLSGQFATLGGNIDSATGSLRQFARQQGRISETSVGGASFGDSGGRGFVDVTDNSETVIRAPDSETGTQVARSLNYRQSKLVQGTS